MSGVENFTKAGPYKLRRRPTATTEEIPVASRRPQNPISVRPLHSTVVEFTSPLVPTEVTPQEISISPIHSNIDFFETLDTTVIRMSTHDEVEDNTFPNFTLITVDSWINLSRDLLVLLGDNENFKNQALVKFSGLVEIANGLNRALHNVIPRVDFGFGNQQSGQTTSRTTGPTTSQSLPPLHTRQTNEQTISEQFDMFSADLMSRAVPNTGLPIPSVPINPVITGGRPRGPPAFRPSTGGPQVNTQENTRRIINQPPIDNRNRSFNDTMNLSNRTMYSNNTYIKKPQIFSGGDVIQLKTWFLTFENTCRANCWPEEVWPRECGKAWEGPAAAVYANRIGYNPDNDWEEVKSELISYYGGEHETFVATERLHSTKRWHFKDSIDYVMAMETIGRASGLDDCAIIRYTINGLEKQVQQWLNAGKQVQDINSLMYAITHAESTYQMGLNDRQVAERNLLFQYNFEQNSYQIKRFVNTFNGIPKYYRQKFGLESFPEERSFGSNERRSPQRSFNRNKNLFGNRSSENKNSYNDQNSYNNRNSDRYYQQKDNQNPNQFSQQKPNNGFENRSNDYQNRGPNNQQKKYSPNKGQNRSIRGRNDKFSNRSNGGRQQNIETNVLNQQIPQHFQTQQLQ